MNVERSEEWSKITSKERQNIGLTFDEDGEFWCVVEVQSLIFIYLAVFNLIYHIQHELWKRIFLMSPIFRMTFDDFCFYFVNLAVCHMVNLSIFSLQKRWFSTEMEEEWASPHRCGGCINNKETFLNNPQVHVLHVTLKNVAVVKLICPSYAENLILFK